MEEGAAIFQNSFGNDLVIQETHTSRNGANTVLRIKVHIEQTESASLISIQEDSKAMALITRPSQFEKRRKETLFQIVRFFQPSSFVMSFNL